jgi:hypothetical protein
MHHDLPDFPETFPLQHPLNAIIPDQASGDRFLDRTALQQKLLLTQS